MGAYERRFDGEVKLVCHDCGAKKVRLWRRYNAVMEQQKLFCWDCAVADQAGGASISDPDPDGVVGRLVPAVPDDTGTTFWGLTAIPHEQERWWKELPLRDPMKQRVVCRWCNKAFSLDMNARPFLCTECGSDVRPCGPVRGVVGRKEVVESADGYIAFHPIDDFEGWVIAGVFDDLDYAQLVAGRRVGGKVIAYVTLDGEPFVPPLLGRMPGVTETVRRLFVKVRDRLRR